MLENETGHRPLAYVKNQQIKELLQESEQKVWLSLNMFNIRCSLLGFGLMECVHCAGDNNRHSCCCCVKYSMIKSRNSERQKSAANSH